MKHFDIIHLDDETSIRTGFELNAEDNNLTYFGVSNLRDLSDRLNEGYRARVYILDGNFPREPSFSPERIVSEAVETIIKVHSDANIVIHSGDSLAKVQGIPFYNKTKTSCSALIKLLQEQRMFRN
jgi:hypothetical protein